MYITDVLYTVIYNIGAYYEECNKCSDKATGDKTWENFQMFFQGAQSKLRKKIQATTQKTGYHGMNELMPHRLEDTHEALINMESSALSDKKPFQVRQVSLRGSQKPSQL